jgi:hypothetical protein
MGLGFCVSSAYAIFHKEDALVSVCCSIYPSCSKTKSVKGITAIQRDELRVSGISLNVIFLFKKNVGFGSKRFFIYWLLSIEISYAKNKD